MEEKTEMSPLQLYSQINQFQPSLPLPVFGSSGITLAPPLSIPAKAAKETHWLPALEPYSTPSAAFQSEINDALILLPVPELVTPPDSDSASRFDNIETSLSSDDGLPFGLEELDKTHVFDVGDEKALRKRLRRPHSRLQHHGACYQCRRKKWRCSNNRPCEKCIVYGTAQSCDQPDSARYVERPISSRMCIEIQDDVYANMVALKNASVSEGVNFALVRITWEIGMSVNQVLQAFRFLPPNAKKVIDESIQAVQAHAQKTLMKRQSCMTTLKELVAKQEVGRISALGEHGAVDDPPEASDERWGHGRWFSIEFDKNTATRKYCKVGSECAELQGYHPEEFLSRFAENNLPIHTTQFDMLCIAMDTICRYQENRLVKYWRLQKHTDDPQVFNTVFVRCSIIRDFDAMGRKIRTSLVYDYLDEKEYERLSEKAHEKGSEDDLLAISLLPKRSFKDFISEHKRELQFSGKLLDMRKKKSGKEKLDDFVNRLQRNVKRLMAD
ncbi:hypothetical protein GUITHDRAFT_145553 [Guillardia theta CCMP2712]|uniref:Zn(2)-C6 fungal-type domain-containing protein n=1 Tax=Guillardia theta (strain CCMP2712) TaxID=905079 RepID=L1ILC1_GUITC|nr:hypothetical protein GUITHDRAFT_145553 [Guillardia theta CCMP2712]EKX36694.1 hypothetical protein GUITHDRAFT_145553 [Guillardia theta CCMP2712]|eukprot:XP_005823674.1 hypothetical protein GUITHDRAFT_145553 [Guillardia theta CCMP2712]